MRSVCLHLMIVVLACAAQAHAQVGKYTASVVLPEIQLRAGPSWQYPPTMILKKGEQVIIHHEDGTWVAVVPPPGSRSWINHRFLGEFDPNATGKQNATVLADHVEVRLGQDKGGPVPVTQIKLPRGSIVEILGGKTREENTFWYPITPPEGEYRWVPKEAIGSPSPLVPPPAFAQRLRTTNTNTAMLTTNTKKGATINHPGWVKAEEAERAGDYSGAIRIYTSILNELRQKNPDPEAQLICYKRITKCEDRLRLDADPPTVPQKDRPLPASLLPPPGGERASESNDRFRPQQADSAKPSGPRWSGAGNLRRAGFTIDSKQAYALESATGVVMYYVIASGGLGLEPYVNHQVNLYGAVQLRGELRGALIMLATQASAVR